MKQFLSFLLCCTLTLSSPVLAAENSEADLSVSAPSVLLMEASTGTVVYEKNAHEIRHPASITKIMTLILIFDAIERGQISLTDTVTVSEYAASMGGSQVFLEPGETQTVETMIKCISVASANDACVAMAEYLCGSESEFVRQMNERARGLGMKDTTFVNCCGLDTEGHMTSAYDVALMSRELTVNHPEIHNYCTIWMENITHVTAKGSSEFGLTNTNKLIRQYEYATGLKTGSTSLAKYCVSATAEKDGLELIAVVMAAPDYKVRFADATTLLNYGFGKCRLYTDENTDALPDLPVTKGTETAVGLAYDSPFSYLSVKGEDLSDVKKEQILPETVTAPVRKGDVAGRVVVLRRRQGTRLREYPLHCGCSRRLIPRLFQDGAFLSSDLTFFYYNSGASRRSTLCRSRTGTGRFLQNSAVICSEHANVFRQSSFTCATTAER